MSDYRDAEKRRATERRWRREHLPAVRAANRRWYARRRNIKLAVNRRWAQTHTLEIDEKNWRKKEILDRLEARLLNWLEEEGLTVVGPGQLRNPDFIFELNGVRIREFLRAPLPTW